MAAVLGSDEDTAQDALEGLVDMALLESTATGRYGFHDLIRLFARERLAVDAEAGAAALDRLLTFYRDAAAGWFDLALGEYQPHPDALRWFEAEGENVLDVAEAAYAHGAWAIVIGLAASLHHLLAMHGRQTEHQRLLSLAARAGRQSGDVPGEVHSTILLAERMAWVGRAAEALDLYERCLLLADQTGDRAMRGRALVYRGDALRELGEATQARRAYEEALEIDELLGDPGRWWVLTHLAGALRDLGELDKAEVMYREALDIAHGRGNTGSRAWIQTHLCWVLADLSRWDDAADELDASLGACRGADDLVGQERALQFLGKLYASRAAATRSTDYFEKAAESYREAAEIADRRKDAFSADEWTRAASWAAGQAMTHDGTID